MSYPECPLTDEERSEEVLRILDKHLSDSLDKYFKESPFVVAMEQHYNDHQFVHTLREDIKIVKRTFLQRVVTIFTVFLLGGLSFSMWIKYFKD